eukprot:ANDGO_00974.mRNA.1 hypothetical protein CAOG_05785
MIYTETPETEASGSFHGDDSLSLLPSSSDLLSDQDASLPHDLPLPSDASFYETEQKTKISSYSYVLLCVSLLAVSSAGVVFLLIRDVSPFLRAAWRMQVTSFALLPLTMYNAATFFCSKSSSGPELRYREYRLDDHEDIFDDRSSPVAKATAVTFLSKLSLVFLTVLSGVALGLHFGTWIWSLDHTSLSASLLFVTAHPIILSLYKMAKQHYWDSKEFAGCCIAMIGLVITCLDGLLEDDSEITFSGNLVAFAGAVLMAVYLTIGSAVRPQIPKLSFYVFPINFIAMTVLWIASCAAEVPCVACLGEWTSPTNRMLAVLYLGLVPGILGHTIINFLLKRVPPLMISVTLLFEPLIGSVMGWVAGVSPVPGPFTLIGGPIVLAGFVVVNVRMSKHDAPSAGT